MICGYHHFRKHPYVRINLYICIYITNFDAHIFLLSMEGHLLQPKVGTSTNSDFCAVMDCTTTLRIQRLEGSLLWNQPKQNYLVGGFNPKIGSFPQVGVNIKNIWNHHLVTINVATSSFPLKMGTLHIAPWEKGTSTTKEIIDSNKIWEGIC